MDDYKARIKELRGILEYNSRLYYDLDAPGFRTISATKLVRIIETVIKSKSI